jgi:hypothetical protein
LPRENSAYLAIRVCKYKLKKTVVPDHKENIETHVYEVRLHKDGRGDLISDVLPLRCVLACGQPDAINNAISYAKSFSRSHDVLIRVYDEAGHIIETHQHRVNST